MFIAGFKVVLVHHAKVGSRPRGCFLGISSSNAAIPQSESYQSRVMALQNVVVLYDLIKVIIAIANNPAIKKLRPSRWNMYLVLVADT